MLALAVYFMESLRELRLSLNIVKLHERGFSIEIGSPFICDNIGM